MRQERISNKNFKDMGDKVKVIIWGGTGSLGKHIVKALMQVYIAVLTLFVRNIERLPREAIGRCNIIEGDAMNYLDVEAAVGRSGYCIYGYVWRSRRNV
jgi:uncharacterized protein YbjT (DUF2867 family)